MGIDALSARLERDADAAVRTIRESGEADARACLAQAGKDRTRRRDALLEQRARERRQTLERELWSLRGKLRSELLQAQHGLLDRVFTRACERAQAMADDPVLLQALPSHLHEVLLYLGERDAQLLCPPGLASPLRRLLVGRRDIELVVDPAAPVGLRGNARDGSVSIDNTLAARLQRVRPLLEPTLLREVAA